MADAPQTPDDTPCCGRNEPAVYAPRKGQPRNESCRLCPASPSYWNRSGDAELRPLGERD